MNHGSDSSWLGNALILIVCGAVAYSMWSLSASNRELRGQLADLRATTSVAALGAGDLLPAVPIRGVGSDSVAGSLSLASIGAEGALVAFLTTTCPFCEATLPAWSRLAQVAASAGVPFVALSLDDQQATSTYAQTVATNLPLWVLDTTATIPMPVERVPLTVVTGVDGGVEGLWLGRLDEDDAVEIQRALERLGRERTSSRSTAADPTCCETSAPGTGAGRKR